MNVALQVAFCPAKNRQTVKPTWSRATSSIGTRLSVAWNSGTESTTVTTWCQRKREELPVRGSLGGGALSASAAVHAVPAVVAVVVAVCGGGVPCRAAEGLSVRLMMAAGGEGGEGRRRRRRWSG